jgi:sulfate adenylyltransferase subunit 2
MKHVNLFGLDATQVWDTDLAFVHMRAQGAVDTKRTTERRLHEWGILPLELTPEVLTDEHGRKPIGLLLAQEVEQARSQRKRVLFAQFHPLPTGQACLHFNDGRGARYWIPLAGKGLANKQQFDDGLALLQRHLGKDLAIYPHGQLVGVCRQLSVNPLVSLLAYPLHMATPAQAQRGASGNTRGVTVTSAPHLKRLEDQSIHILREAVAESENPAMLYSMGKDSSVMLHVARKAFYPAPLPFPLLHVDTRWKFQQMYQFRDHVANQVGIDLRVHVNPEAIAKDINPFDHGSALHTDITKTEGLKQALDKYKFDLVFGGARRDEEKSRAKERIFSFRSSTHRWDPKSQRPELWSLYNTKKNVGESIRVFPLSDWTELDIWQYIYQQHIAVVPLYFSKERPVVVRGDMIVMVDDDRFRLLPGEKIQARKVRFRTLGCYPLTGAVESEAQTIADIILELIHARSSERQGRAIDSDASASMEKKKQEGYF